jgi:hypothetical protein
MAGVIESMKRNINNNGISKISGSIIEMKMLMKMKRRGENGNSGEGVIESEIISK